MSGSGIVSDVISERQFQNKFKDMFDGSLEDKL